MKIKYSKEDKNLLKMLENIHEHGDGFSRAENPIDKEMLKCKYIYYLNIELASLLTDKDYKDVTSRFGNENIVIRITAFDNLAKEIPGWVGIYIREKPLFNEFKK